MTLDKCTSDLPADSRGTLGFSSNDFQATSLCDLSTRERHLQSSSEYVSANSFDSVVCSSVNSGFSSGSVFKASAGSCVLDNTDFVPSSKPTSVVRRMFRPKRRISQHAMSTSRPRYRRNISLLPGVRDFSVFSQFKGFSYIRDTSVPLNIQIPSSRGLLMAAHDSITESQPRQPNLLSELQLYYLERRKTLKEEGYSISVVTTIADDGSVYAFETYVDAFNKTKPFNIDDLWATSISQLVDGLTFYDYSCDDNSPVLYRYTRPHLLLEMSKPSPYMQVVKAQKSVLTTLAPKRTGEVDRLCKGLITSEVAVDNSLEVICSSGTSSSYGFAVFVKRSLKHTYVHVLPLCHLH
ncbi:unnamed protein product [Allacma fusca]|uniref:Uncharacterized protein n=1 Tax=Allacma fusca TaxID=39272 RepID=A0A8J2JNU1_9HEXA|nr:unnamed protein product [Allacma fusca]